MDNINIEQNQINYPECDKGEFHLGEKINMVCTDNDCLEKQKVGCSACMELVHKKHQILPIKMLFYKSQSQLTNKDSKQSINYNEILQYIEVSKQKYLQLNNQLQMEVNEMFENVRKEHSIFYDNISKTLIQKQNQVLSDLEFQQMIQQFYIDEQPAKLFTENIEKFLKFLKVSTQNLNTELLKESIDYSSGQILDELNLLKNDLKKKLEDNKKNAIEFQNTFIFPEGDIEELNKFKFTTLKHSDIQVINPTTVTATTNNGYKFALLDQALPKNKKVKFGFKILEKGSSDWMGLGVCHKNTVQKKNFQWTTPLGHGGYLISSQAYSWSTISTEQNSKYTSFPYTKNDTVYCEYDPFSQKVTFTNDKNSSKCTINLKLDDKDPLHPCVLFYYSKYKVQFINQVK